MGQSMRCIGGVAHGSHVTVEGRDYLVPVPHTYNTHYMSEMVMRLYPDSSPNFRTERYVRKLVTIKMRGRGLTWTYAEEVLVPVWMSDESTEEAIKALGFLFERERGTL